MRWATFLVIMLLCVSFVAALAPEQEDLLDELFAFPDARPASEGITSGLLSVKAWLEDDTIGFRVKNHALLPAENVRLRVSFSKVIAATPDNLDVEGVEYTVEDGDFIFIIPVLEDNLLFSVKADHVLDDSYIEGVTLEGLTYMMNRDKLTKRIEETERAVMSEIFVVPDDGVATVTLSLEPREPLTNVKVPVVLPPCLWANADFEGQHERLSTSVVVWELDEVREGETLSFSVPGNVSEECRGGIRYLVFAEQVGAPLPWIALLIIPGFVVVMLFIHHRHPHNHPGHKRKK